MSNLQVKNMFEYILHASQWKCNESKAIINKFDDGRKTHGILLRTLWRQSVKMASQ